MDLDLDITVCPVTVSMVDNGPRELRAAGDLPDGQISEIASSPFCKNISVFPKCKSVYILCRPVSQRGVAQRHGRGAGCGGRGWCQRRGCRMRTAKSCGPDAAVLASSLREEAQATVARKPITGEITKETVNHCAGNAGLLR